MKYCFHPDYKVGSQGFFEKFIRKNLFGNTKMLARLKDFLEKLEKVHSLEAFGDSGYMCFLGRTFDEFRIPPHTKSGGVLRLYFSLTTYNGEPIVCIFNAEYKKGDPDKNVQDLAEKRATEFFAKGRKDSNAR